MVYGLPCGLRLRSACARHCGHLPVPPRAPALDPPVLVARGSSRGHPGVEHTRAVMRVTSGPWCGALCTPCCRPPLVPACWPRCCAGRVPAWCWWPCVRGSCGEGVGAYGFSPASLPVTPTIPAQPVWGGWDTPSLGAGTEGSAPGSRGRATGQKNNPADWLGFW